MFVTNYAWFFIAAVFEIAGCYAFWVWLRQDKSMLWLIPGLISLALFAYVLTKIEADFAGRAYAAYGGIYIVSSLLWLAYIENERVILSDYVGVVFSLLGATIIFFGPSLFQKVG